MNYWIGKAKQSVQNMVQGDDGYEWDIKKMEAETKVGRTAPFWSWRENGEH